MTIKTPLKTGAQDFERVVVGASLFFLYAGYSSGY